MRNHWIVFGFFFGTTLGLKVFDKSLNKDGECPALTKGCLSLLPNRCAVDIDCNGTKKCCFDGCIMRCQPPLLKRKINSNTAVCEAKIDLGFLIDSSASIGYQNFKRVRKMVDRIINVFTISPDKTHVAVIMINDVPKHALRFNTFQGKDLNKENVRRVIDNLEFAKGKTRIDLALRMAFKEMFSKRGGGRLDARKILIVFTDGIQTWEPAKMTKLTKASEPLKRIGVTIIPVGVWKEMINVGSLLDMSMDSNTVYNMEFFPELLQALKKMSKIPCKDKRKNGNHQK